MTIPRFNTERLELIVQRARDSKKGLAGSLSGKSIQLQVDGQPYLRIDSGDLEHQDILMGFIEECSTAGEPVVSPQELAGIKNGKPPLKLGRYEVVGMGDVNIYPDLKLMGFSGYSMCYDSSTNEDHLALFTEYIKGWKLNIEID